MTIHKTKILSFSDRVLDKAKSISFVYGAEKKSSKVFGHLFSPISGSTSMVGGVHRCSPFFLPSAPSNSKLNLNGGTKQ